MPYLNGFVVNLNTDWHYNETKLRDLLTPIFGSRQIKVTQIFSLLLEEREELIIQRGASSLPVGPLDPDVSILIL